jgi:hypothetical protein
MAQEVKRNTVALPNRPPIKTSGIVISTVLRGTLEKKLTSSMKAEKSKKQAKEAEPTEYPLVLALVTFPTASNKSVTYLTSSGCSLISAIPIKNYILKLRN